MMPAAEPDPRRGKGTVVLVGAGLGGSLMAILLGKAGYAVRGYELRPDPRTGSARGGRSINLALSARGMHALERVGLAREILAMAVPMRGRMIHSQVGRTAFQPYGTAADQVNHSVSRGDLNIVLLTAAEKLPDVRFSFGRKCQAVDPASGEVTVLDSESGETRHHTCDVVIGADGAFSVVRRQFLKEDRFDYQQAFLSHGYKELTIPAAPGGGFLLEKNALHIWPRGGFMMIALPNRDGSLTCTLFLPFEGDTSFAALATETEVCRFFERVFPDAIRLIPDLAAQYFANPTGSMVTIRCSPWHSGGRVVLLGDASHAVVPFHGQGANAAFEDCVVLDDCIRRKAPDWAAVFASFEALRKENTDALADLSIANFEEMKHHTGSRLFLMKKALEKGLHRLFPSRFVPLYMMISFTLIPYAEARRRARRQARALLTATAGALILALLLLFWLSRG
jgi:kynurenine 3-monooxygenase